MENENKNKAAFVSDLFEKGKSLFSSRAAECYEAIDLKSQQAALLWVLRYPLDPNSQQSKLFTSRLQKISKSSIKTLPIISYGVDSRGTAFLATHRDGAKLVIDSTWVPFELEKYFVEALQLLKNLHVSGFSLEDVSESSFLLNAKKELVFGSILGEFNDGAKQTAMLPPKETLRYVAPEQSSGGAANSQTDIFSIGIFGYRLFTGQYPMLKSDANSLGVHDALPPSKIRSDLPAWVDDVIGQCLELEPSKRYSSVDELLNIVQKSIASGKAPGGSSVWSKNAVKSSAKKSVVSKELISVPKKEKKAKEQSTASDFMEEIEAKESSFKSSLLLWIASIAIGFGIAAFSFLSIGSFDLEDEQEAANSYLPSSSTESNNDTSEENLKGDDPIAFMAEYSPPELREFIHTVSTTDASVEDRKLALAQIADSKDPTSFGMLTTLIQNGRELFLRQEASALLVEKIKKEDLLQTSRILEKWLATLESNTNSKKSSPYLLRAVDIGRPLRTRIDSLKQAYVSDPGMATKIAGSLAIDSGEDGFTDVLRGFLSEKFEDQDLSQKGIGSLLMSDSELSELIDNDASEIIEKFSDNDLLWALERASDASSDKKAMLTLAEEILKRKALSPFKQVFIEALIESVPVGESSHHLSSHLIKGALGSMSQSDVESFARWDSLQAERVLLAACASSSPEISLKSFDILARRTITNSTAESFVDWVKSRFWDYRKRFVKSVGVLSLRDLASDDQISSAFDDLLPFTKGGLFKVFGETNDPDLIMESIDRMGAITTSAELLALIDNPSSKVRIAALRALKDRNELFVLQAILKTYKKEKDESVRKVYEELHWVTQQGSGRR